jgi:thioredoxin-related protein
MILGYFGAVSWRTRVARYDVHIILGTKGEAMSKKFWILPLALVAALAVACQQGVSESGGESEATPKQNTASTEPIVVKSLAAAREKAKSAGRNILVVYGSESCPWSRQMDEGTLADDDVRAMLRSFVYLRIQQGKNAEEFEKAWGKQPTPTVVTLDADGKPIGKMVNGVVKKADFLAYASWAKTGNGPQPGFATGGG